MKIDITIAYVIAYFVSSGAFEDTLIHVVLRDITL